jgi:serine/threonine protein phosphatase PrpC
MDGSVTSATAIGLRPAQEDRYAVVRVDEHGRRGWALAVFDGHSGAETADTAASRFEDAFRRTLERGRSDETIVRISVEIVRDEVADRVEGSSVSVAWIDEEAGRAAFGVLGDSPVIVRGEDGRTILGPLHNAIVNVADRDRAIERGALYMGGYLVDPRTLEGVNLTRTIGDAPFGFLGRESETFGAALGTNSYVLVATDGVFTDLAPGPDALVGHIDALVDEGKDAQDIVDDALAGGTEDNVTVLLWRV